MVHFYAETNTYRRQFAQKAFNTYLRHLSGCKFLLHRLIALPIIGHLGSVDVEMFRDLTKEWATYKNSNEYQEATERLLQCALSPNRDIGIVLLSSYPF